MRTGFFFCILGWMSFLHAMTPGESALDFVTKLQSGSLHLEPGEHTALSEATRPEKIDRITRRLERLREEIDGSELEVGPVETEGDLAGVLIRSTNVTDLTRLKVLPIAMIRINGQWRIAPVLASFENTPVTTLRKYRESIAKIETWLAKEGAAERERLELVARKAVREKLATIVSPEELRSAPFEKVVDRFTKACSEQDTGTILALSGGLSEVLPADWLEHCNTLQLAMAGEGESEGAWSLLLDQRNFLLPVMVHEASEGLHEAHLVSLIPSSRENTAYECISLQARQSVGGLWIFDTPRVETSRRTLSSMLDLFPSKLQLKHPPSGTETAEELRDRILAHLRQGNPTAWAGLTNLQGNPEEQRTLCYRAAAKWSGIHDSDHRVLPVELEMKHDDSEAFLAIQWLAINNLSFAPDILHLEKTKGGWLWNPMPSKESIALAREWAEERRDEWRKNYEAQTIDHCPMADFSLKPVEAKVAERLVQNWIQSLAQGKWTKALGACAQLGTPKTPKLLLRNLSADCKHIVRNKGKITTVSSLSGKHVSLVATSETSVNSTPDLYVTVVPTKDGPRILQEIDLGDPKRRGRAFLNRESLERLEAHHKKAGKDLAELIGKLSEATPE